MFCPNCGTQVPQGALFCPSCGKAMPSAAAPQAEPVQPQPAQPQPQAGGGNTPPVPPVPPASSTPPKAPKKGPFPVKLAVALVGVVAVAVVAVAAVKVLGGAMADPKDTLDDALNSTKETLTAETVSQVKELDAVQVLSNLGQTNTSQSLTLGIKSLPDSMSYQSISSLLEGARISYLAESDPEQKQMALELSAGLGNLTLGSARVFINDTNIALNSPQLVGDDFYAVDLADLSAFGVPSDQQELISKYMDFMWQSAQITSLSEDTTSRLDQAYQELYDSAEVTKGEKESVSVNGSSVDCTRYDMILSYSDLQDFLLDCFDIIAEDEMITSTLDAYSSMGMMYGVSDPLAEFRTAYEQVVSQIQEDVDVVTYLDGGKLMRMELSTELSGAGIEATLEFGGGDNYADDLSLEVGVSSGGSTMQLSYASSGNHTAADGAYTDESQFSLSFDGETLVSGLMETSYDSKASSDNFSWALKLDVEGQEVDLSADGTVTADAKAGTLEAELDSIAIEANGEKLVLFASYSVSPLTQFSFDGSDARLISSLSDDELYQLSSDIQTNLFQHLNTIQQTNPTLGYLMESLF